MQRVVFAPWGIQPRGENFRVQTQSMVQRLALLERALSSFPETGKWSADDQRSPQRVTLFSGNQRHGHLPSEDRMGRT